MTNVEISEIGVLFVLDKRNRKEPLRLLFIVKAVSPERAKAYIGAIPRSYIERMT